MQAAILILVGFLALAFAGMALLALLLLVQIYFLVIKRRWVRSIALPPITGYTPSPSYTVGDRVPFHVHTTRPAAARLLRLGRKAEPTGWMQTLPTTLQSPRYDFWHGLSWPVTFTLDTDELLPGMYHLQLEQSEDRSARYSITFLLSPAAPTDVAVIVATNTWQAYNDFAGLSNYSDRVTPFPLSIVTRVLKALNWGLRLGDRHYVPSVPLPENRPNDVLDRDFRQLDACPTESPSHVGRNDWAFVRFLEHEQVPHGLFSDRDFALDTRPSAARLVIFVSHSEYWSSEMAARYLAYLDRGGKVLFVSGNNVYQTVVLLDQSLVVINFRNSLEEMARLTGLAYDARGFQTYAGFRIWSPEHWAFAGLDVKRGDVFAEADGGRGGSGFETDKLHPSGGTCSILAVGRNAEGPGFIICREQASGGWIVNLGSVASAAWVSQDHILGGIVRNCIQRALQSAD